VIFRLAMQEIYRKLTRSLGSSIAALGALLSISTVLLFLVDLQARYWDRIATAKTEAQSFAKILAEHTALTFDEIDKALLEAEAIRQNTPAGKYDAPGSINAALRQLQRSSSVLVAIGWTDSSGELLAHSYRSEPPRRNISDLPHFIVQRESSLAGLFIAPPFRSAVDGKWLTAASRRLSSPDGSFAGVVTAPIDQSYFTKLYRSIDLGKSGSVVLLHREGRILAREPEAPEALGKSFADGPLLTKYLPESDVGAYEAVSGVDGVARIVGYKGVPGLPLVLLVTYARSDVLQLWYRHLYTAGLVVAAIVAMIFLGTALLVRQTSALAAKSRALASTNARFDAALSNMPHGLSMFDADEKLLVCNARYLEIYGLAEEQLTAGTPFREILKLFGQRAEETDFSLDAFRRGAKRRVPHILKLANGSIISIQRTPMKDGGWVATHEDITERQHADAMLVANAAELKLINERFEVAINNMSQGLCLFDADKNLVVSNRRYREMYELPDRLVLPGTPLRQILQYYYDRGERADLTVDQYTDLLPAQAKQTYQPNDGRNVLIQRQPLMDGGWVATHEDVTEQKRAERLLAEKAAELEAINLRFNAALNNMSQGLCMFDAEQRVVVANTRYAEIYHLTPDQVKPGTQLRQVLEYRRQKGTNFATLTDEHLSANVKKANEVQELADSRVVAISCSPMPNGGWLTTHEDITDRALNEKRIAFLAQHDVLTGLANRALFSEKLEEAARRLQRHGSTFTVLMLDLDKFKDVNDTLGHPAGDQLLIEVGKRLRSSLRDIDVLARLGGDEFAIIQENEKSQDEGAIALALRIIALVEQPFDLNGNSVGIGTSIGIALAPRHGADSETLLQRADLALYAAKSGGRNDFRIFEPELTEAVDSLRSIDSELREAIAGDQFNLHYQPIFDLKTLRASSIEAFVRWQHPSKGLLAPDKFLSLAEKTGLAAPLGEWILQRACADAAALPSHVKLAINISAVQVRKGNLFDVILCALVDSGLSPERLEIEISDVIPREGDAMRHLQTIRQLKNLGVSVVLDNCEAAHSCLRLAFDKIKIDKVFTQAFTHRRDYAAMVASVVSLARGLGIPTVAKGIETRDEFEAVRAAGIDFAQGYLLARPVPFGALDLEVAAPYARNVA
jgi:diguanylate cyclase (GGDEF)-like protein